MSTITIAIFLLIPSGMAAVVWMAWRRAAWRRAWFRIPAAILSLMVLLFSIFGYLAAGEPGDPSVRLAFRLLYGGMGAVALAALGCAVLAPGASPGGGRQRGPDGGA